MKSKTACNREQFIEKLKELNFYGPLYISGHQFMSYSGRSLAIPGDKEYSVAQFRFMLQEIDRLISDEEWRH